MRRTIGKTIALIMVSFCIVTVVSYVFTVKTSNTYSRSSYDGALLSKDANVFKADLDSGGNLLISRFVGTISNAEYIYFGNKPGDKVNIDAKNLVNVENSDVQTTDIEGNCIKLNKQEIIKLLSNCADGKDTIEGHVNTAEKEVYSLVEISGKYSGTLVMYDDETPCKVPIELTNISLFYEKPGLFDFDEAFVVVALISGAIISSVVGIVILVILLIRSDKKRVHT